MKTIDMTERKARGGGTKSTFTYWHRIRTQVQVTFSHDFQTKVRI